MTTGPPDGPLAASTVAEPRTSPSLEKRITGSIGTKSLLARQSSEIVVSLGKAPPMRGLVRGLVER